MSSEVLISDCEINWEDELHSFTFHTGGNSLEAADSLSDLIGSLQHLYDHIVKKYPMPGPIPDEINVEGGSMATRFSTSEDEAATADEVY